MCLCVCVCLCVCLFVSLCVLFEFVFLFRKEVHGVMKAKLLPDLGIHLFIDIRKIVLVRCTWLLNIGMAPKASLSK